jgi:hypothetical protein
MPQPPWPLAHCACVPTISLFDPPTYVVASLREALTGFCQGESANGEARPREERTSTAAGLMGTGQDCC